MRHRVAALALVAVLAGGCAVPGWVPFFGKKKEEAATPPPPPSPPPVVEKPVAPLDEDVVDRIVAVVNNDAITLGELQEAVLVYRQEQRGRVSRSDAELQREFLGRLIDTRLQLQEAEREQIVVEDAEIDEELAERMKRFGARSVQELEALVKAQGLNMDAIRRRVRDSLRVQKVIRRKVALRVSVTDAEIDRYLADNRDKLESGLTYHARHILITPESDTDAGWEQARIRANMVRDQALAGADFAELARAHSRDASAKDGGDLGTLKRGELAQEIESQILALSPGDISAPYRSPLGWHLFRLESKESLEGESLARARQQVRDILYREKYEARLRAWLREIKDRAIIEVRM